ncbi:Hypothetical predicted protein [Lecanosticta acicola]|uniref:DUF4470 domain-containing protein n=1 Tax=Lecanosticta acicola TaxID=111012 RepID=A0AAI9EA12_9PEZI|nr:Hypothetical predicted protein [Lecanosticta acicola]
MFGGIGDGRNLLASLGRLTAAQTQTLISDKRSFHFTIVDLNNAIIARNILVIIILWEVGKAIAEEKCEMEKELLPCLYYTYLVPIMPTEVHAVLQKRYEFAIEMLEDARSMPPVLEVPNMYPAGILRVLRQWQFDAGRQFPPCKLRSEVVQQRLYDVEHQPFGGDMSAPWGCEKEEMFYRAAGILTPPSFTEGLETNLLHAYQRFNVARPNDVSKENPEFTLGHNPFSLGVSLTAGERQAPAGRTGLYDVIKPFFSSAADAVNRLQERLKVEACVRDITCVLEQIRYGVVGHRQGVEPSGSVQDLPTSTQVQRTNLNGQKDDEYPKMYDRIHLSNIPDYIGGSLATFLYAAPLVYPGDASYVTFNNLRNPGSFMKFEHYNNEYAVLSNESDLRTAFQVRTGERDMFESFMSFPVSRYTKWHHHPLEKSSSNLMPASRMRTWLLQLFFKIAIPKDRIPRANSLVFSPMNLTNFCRVCRHLHNSGYPAHWISEVLDDVYSGTVLTRARPPRSCPLQIKEVRANKTGPALAQSTRPFVAEMPTLGSIWQFALPFGITSPLMPPIDQIHKYSIKFGNIRQFVTDTSSFILVLFFSRHYTPASEGVTPPFPQKESFRLIFLSDEEGRTSKGIKNLRNNLHAISTWQRDGKKETASFWMRKDVMEPLREGKEWVIEVWRTDVWMRQSAMQYANRIKDEGPFSTEERDSK